MHLYTCEAAIASKKLRNPGGRCTSVLAGTPKKQAFSTDFDPPQLHERDTTEPHIWPNVCLADALPREPSRIVRGQPEQTAAWPKHGDASCSHGTHHTEPISVFARCNPSAKRPVHYSAQCAHGVLIRSVHTFFMTPSQVCTLFFWPFQECAHIFFSVSVSVHINFMDIF